MEIAVDGYRAGAMEREAAGALPVEALPALSPSQREYAAKWGISPEEYARSIVAGERSEATLRFKAERLGRLLQSELDRVAQGAVVEKVWFRVFQEAFEVAIRSDGQRVPLRIVEAVVDEVFEAGSEEAEARIRRIVDLAFPRRVQ